MSKAKFVLFGSAFSLSRVKYFQEKIGTFIKKILKNKKEDSIKQWKIVF